MVEIGRRLRAAREAKGLTLDVVEEETKIRRKYIEALEAGESETLPGDAYLKGFLRTYGNYLGLDGPGLVEEYKHSRERHSTDGHSTAHRSAATRTPAPHREPAEPVHERPRERPAAQRSAAAEQAASVRELAQARRDQVAAPEPAIRREEIRYRPNQPADRRNPRPRRGQAKPDSGALRTLGISAVVVALVGAVIYLGWLIFSQGAPVASPKQQEPAPTPPPAAVTQPEPATPAPKLPDPPKVTMSRANSMDVIFAVPAKEITVKIEVGAEAVWYQAVVDGKTTAEKTTQAREFKGADIRIQMGHMEGISLVVNGQRFDRPLEGGPYNLIFKGQ